MSGNNVKTCTVQEVWNALQEEKTCQLADVREYPEFISGKIKGPILVSKSALVHTLHRLDPQKTEYLFCAKGPRARKVAEKLIGKGFDKLVVVEGGVEAWKGAGYPVKLGAMRVWPIERQVRFFAGSLALFGTLLGGLVHPGFLSIPALIGGGLAYSALSNTCGMSALLFLFPWNKEPETP